MATSIRGTALLSAALFAGGCAAQSNPEEMLVAADSLDERYLAAFNAGSLDAVMETMWRSPDLVSYSPDGKMLKGWSAVRDGIQQALQSMPGTTFEFVEQQNRVEGAVVMGWGAWRATVPDGAGAAVVVDGRYTDVKARRDGKWVYVMDHGSVLPR